MQRGIATLLAIALVLWAVGAHMFTNKVEAANLTYVKDTLSTSATSTASNHTIEFKSPTGVGANATVTVEFPGGSFTGTSSVLFSDVDLEINGVDETVVAGAPAAAEWGFSWAPAGSGNILRFLSGSGESIASNATVTIKIGTNASGPGVNQLINPLTSNSYEIGIAAGTADTGFTRVAILDRVLVTADVNTSLTFTVSGTSTGIAVNGSPTTTSTTTTSNALPFGLLSTSSKTLAQDLTVATNALHGYIVTVETNHQLLSSTGADIDGFIDGAYTNSPASWVAPTASISNEDTWGHWGLTTNDTTLQGAIDFASNQWISASTTPRVIMAHSGPADGSTDDIGITQVGYQVQISALQEAGDDYNATLTYIATPTF